MSTASPGQLTVSFDELLFEPERHSPRPARDFYSDDSMRELAKSIRQNGLFVPLVVIDTSPLLPFDAFITERYRVMFGGRRYMALKSLKELPGPPKAVCELLQHIPIIIHVPISDKVIMLSLMESPRNVPLTHAEIGEAMLKLKQRFNMNAKEIAAAIGRSERTVYRYLDSARKEKERMEREGSEDGDSE